MAIIDYTFQGAPPTGTGSGAIVCPGSLQAPSVGLDTTNLVWYFSAGNGWIPMSSGIVAKVDLLAKNAAISATTMYTVPANMAGTYSVTWDAKVTTAATGTATSILTGSTGVVFTYTDKDDAANPSTVGTSGPTGNALTTTANGVAIMNCAASSIIQYACGYTSADASTMKYSLHVRLIYMG